MRRFGAADHPPSHFGGGTADGGGQRYKGSRSGKGGRELVEADIILLLISADFLATEYIWEVEITQAMVRYEKGETTVIPIILRPCDWENMPFGKLNGLPEKGKPVIKWEPKDDAWLEIVNGIKKVL